jgi:CoA:oxalate CoA-transferase
LVIGKYIAKGVEAMGDLALSGVKVLDFSWYIAGPYCTKLLADYGADVIKVEKPSEGDPARKMGPFFKDDPDKEKSGLFLHLNTNKKGITLNLKSIEGKKIVRELVRKMDIVVENFSPRVMPGLKLDYKVLKRFNPNLVMTSVSNFGQRGPYRDFRASEIVEYAMGGEMYSTGIKDKEPLKLGGNVAQYLAGNVAAVATLGAFLGIDTVGEGQHVDISIMETQASNGDRRSNYILAYLGAGVVTDRWVPPREGTRVVILPQGVYPCKDGFINTLSMPSWFPRYVKVLGMPELQSDPRFQNVYNAEMVPEFDAIWYNWLADHTKQEVFERCLEASIASAPVNNTADVVNYSHLKDREYFAEIEHPVTGKLTYTGAPFKMSESPWQLRSPAPLLGQHNEEIYTKMLGYSKKDLTKLRESGVI